MGQKLAKGKINYTLFVDRVVGLSEISKNQSH